MSDTVTVACKLPAGLVLRLFDMVDDIDPTPGGGFKKVKRAQIRDGKPVVINGYNQRYNASVDTAPKATMGAFALTHGVDKEFFEEWLKQNASLPAVKNGLIFAHGDQDFIQGHIREHEDVKTGLEPLNPQALPSQFRNRIATEARPS